MRQLIWFRTDLRVADNPALAGAMAAGPTVALYLITPAQWREHDDAPCKVDFWLRNLSELRRELGRLNVPLLVRTAPTWQALPDLFADLCSEFAIDAVHLNREAGVNELRRDRAVSARLALQSIESVAHHGATLVPPGSVRNQAGNCYRIFSQFRRAVLPRLGNLPPRPVPPAQAPIAISADPIPVAVADFPSPATTLRELWSAGETAALARLREFVDTTLPSYDRERDFPARCATSQLSPYLAAGVVSPRQCLWAALNAADGALAAGNDGAGATWITELLWREFYRHLLEAHPRLSMGQPFQPATAALSWRHAPDDLAAWQQGRTGIPIVDAAMRQLLATGWMHNRLRMVSAMFLTKNLLIDWREGERWFMRHLIDGDLAANNGGWQWSASTGTDAAPYFRVFNPVSQSRRFDPAGEFIRRWVPELAALPDAAIHEPDSYEGENAAAGNGDLFAAGDSPGASVRPVPAGYPPPIVDLKSSRLRAIAAFRALPRGGNAA